MEKAIKYLEDNSSVNANDVVSISLEKLTVLIKIVQLETMIEFILMNYPEELGLLQTFQFELKHLLKVKESEEISNDEGDISF